MPTYLFGCEEGSLIRSRKPKGSCTFTAPGVHWIQLLVQDNKRLCGPNLDLRCGDAQAMTPAAIGAS